MLKRITVIIVGIMILVGIGCSQKEIKIKEFIKKFNGMTFQLNIPQRHILMRIGSQYDFYIDIFEDITIKLFEGEDTNGPLITKAIVILRVSAEEVKGYNEKRVISHDGVYKTHPPWLGGVMVQNLEIFVQYKGKQSSAAKFRVVLVKG